MSSEEKGLFEAADELQEFFAEQGWPYAFIGGLANLRWGRPRTTQDVDGTILTSFHDEEKVIDVVLKRFGSRISEPRQFAMDNRVLLLVASNGVEADISLGGFSFEQEMIRRSTLYSFHHDYALRTCSAEDLIVLKAFAARDQDWIDVRWILERQKGQLDLDYIRKQLRPLAELKEAPEIMDRLEEMIHNVK